MWGYPEYRGSWKSEERGFIADSLLYDKLLMSDLACCFDLHYKHRKLANDSIKVIAMPGVKSASEALDYLVLTHLVQGVRRKAGKLSLDMAAHFVANRSFHIEEYTRKIYPQFTSYPAYVRLAALGHYFKENPLDMVDTPFDAEQYEKLLKDIDFSIFDHQLLESLEDQFDPVKAITRKGLFEADFQKSFEIAEPLIISDSYTNAGLHTIPSLDSSLKVNFCNAFFRFKKELFKRDPKIAKDFRSLLVSNDLFQTLFDEQLKGKVVELIGFRILDPLSLVEYPNTNIDDVIIRLRRKGKISKIRNLLDRLIMRLEEGEIEQATQTKIELEYPQFNEDLNREIIDQMRQFGRKKVVEEAERKIDEEISAKKLGKDARRVFEVSGGVLLILSFSCALTSCIGLPAHATGNLDRIISATSAGIGSGNLFLRLGTWLIQNKLGNRTGYDFYALFHDWPKVSRKHNIRPKM